MPIRIDDIDEEDADDTLVVNISCLPSGSRRISVECKSIEDVSKLMDEIMPNEPTTQERHKHIYQLLAWGSGALLLVFILVIAVLIPSPTSFQYRVFIALLAIAGGAFGVVITGLLDVKAAFGKQLAIGATGALALVVLLLLIDPSASHATP